MRERGGVGGDDAQTYRHMHTYRQTHRQVRDIARESESESDRNTHSHIHRHTA